MKRCKHFWGYAKAYVGRHGLMMVLNRCNHCGKEKRARLPVRTE